MDAVERAAGLRLMAFDVDGVLTDGRLYYSAAGDELKAFSTQDGHGLKLLREGGVHVAIITARSSGAVTQRAANLGIDLLFQGVSDKGACLRQLGDRFGLSPQALGYMGDDVIDLPAMRVGGFAATVPDGHWLVKKHVHFIAQAPAGRGAVREVAEYILRAQDRLDGLLARYLA